MLNALKKVPTSQHHEQGMKNRKEPLIKSGIRTGINVKSEKLQVLGVLDKGSKPEASLKSASICNPQAETYLERQHFSKLFKAKALALVLSSFMQARRGP